MQYFLYTSDTIPDGLGFSHFSPTHLLWLGFALLLLIGCCVLYCRLNEDGRRRMRRIVAAALVLDELWKDFWLLVGGNFSPDYLPLHLCSINIILIAIHCIHPGKLLDNFLYLLCIPGALAALLFPTWTGLPFFNFMHLHSFTVHILLLLYPVMLFAGNDIRPTLRDSLKSLVLLIPFVLLAAGANALWGTNFMFLSHADPGNPLYLFETLCGEHLVGYPVLALAVMAVMLPLPTLRQKLADHRTHAHTAA